MKKVLIGFAVLVVAITIWRFIRNTAQHSIVITSDAVAASSACGALLNEQLAHVYHPDRLHVMQDCKVVTGTIDLVRSERDGDYHIRLRLDPGQGELTNARNDERQDGDLVVEPICEHNVTQADAVASCQDFSGGVPRPRKGTHVRVVGPYVRDADHGWMEIHPAVSIEEIPLN